MTEGVAGNNERSAVTSWSTINSIVSEVLSSKLAPMGYAGVDVAIEKDFDGEDIIRVNVDLPRRLTDSDLLFDAASDIRQRLIAQGDDRFVFIRQNARQGPGDAMEEEVEDDVKGSSPS